MCQIMTALVCFVLDALLHVDQSRGVGKQVFGDRRVALADRVAVVHGNVCEKPCRFDVSYVNTASGVFRTCSSATCPVRSERVKKTGGLGVEPLSVGSLVLDARRSLANRLRLTDDVLPYGRGKSDTVILASVRCSISHASLSD